MPILDLDFVRSQFSVFSTDPGRQIAFFDNAGGSYVADAVVDRLTDFYRHYKVQPYGPTALAQKAGVAMDLGRQTMADLLHVSIDEVTIGPSATQNINTLAQACAPLLHKQAEVIVSEQDHEANIGGWERACRQQGATLRIWKVEPETGELSLERLKELLNENTAIISLTQSSNVIGSPNPINEIADLVKPFGVRVVVDGVSFAPHRWPKLDELKADAYVFSTYKTYGPHLGVMVVRKDFLEELAPQCHFFNTPYLYKRLDAAGPNHAAIAALAGIGDHFAAIHDHHFGADDSPLHEKAHRSSSLMNEHEKRICTLLLEGLNTLPVRIYGHTSMKDREANVAFRSEKVSSKNILHKLADHHIAAKQGNFYAYRLLQAMKVPDLNDGVLRLSFSHYNTEEEVRRCVEALQEIVG